MGPEGSPCTPPPPPGSSMSGIILFSGPHWSIIKMLTPYKLGRPHLFGHFSKWPPSKSSENWIAHILAFGQPRNTNLCLNPHFQGHWFQWECYKCDNIMYLWEIQDGCHFQLIFEPILVQSATYIIFLIQMLYHFINDSVFWIKRTCLRST